MMQPLGNFTLNPKYRLKLLGSSGLSILLATRLVEGFQDNRLKLAKRILTRTHELPEISPPTLAATLDRSKGGHSSSVYSIAFHPTLPILATSSYDKTVKLWRLVYTPDGSISAATCVATLDSSNGGHSRSVSSVAFHPTLPFLVTGSDDKTAKLWRLDNPDGSAATCVATLEGHNDSIRSVTFHQRLPFLVTVSDDNSVKLWKL